MKIEVVKGRKINGEQLYEIIVNGETIYGNMTYNEVCEITIGDLDRA